LYGQGPLSAVSTPPLSRLAVCSKSLRPSCLAPPTFDLGHNLIDILAQLINLVHRASDLGVELRDIDDLAGVFDLDIAADRQDVVLVGDLLIKSDSNLTVSALY